MKHSKLINNINERVVDDIKGRLSKGTFVSIAAASFSIYAYEDELARKRRAAEALQKRVRNERQFAKQMELNSEARALKREIAKLEEVLKTLENN